MGASKRSRGGRDWEDGEGKEGTLVEGTRRQTRGLDLFEDERRKC